MPNFEILKEWANKEGIDVLSNEQLVTSDKVINKYKEIVNELNQKFGRVEQIKSFKLMAQEFTQENGELTPTLKIKRKVIANKYKDDIEKLYV